MRGIYTLIYKDFKRMLKRRGILLTMFFVPFLIISALMFSIGIISLQAAQHLIVSIIVGFTFFPATTSSVLLAIELEHGLTKDLFSSPISRTEIVLGKIISGVLTVLLIPIILLLLSLIVRYFEAVNWPFAIVCVILTAFYLNCFSFTLAVKLKSFHSFYFIQSIVMLVLLLCSNFIIPLPLISEPLKTIATLNPITHTISLLRFSVNLNHETDPFISLAFLFVVALIAFFLSFFTLKKEIG